LKKNMVWQLLIVQISYKFFKLYNWSRTVQEYLNNIKMIKIRRWVTMKQ
jgi:hypothetical protein